jgi:hypothetical protein
VSDRQAIAANVAQSWQPGFCHYCGVTEEQVDGDHIRWLGAKRTVCSQPGCIRRFNSDIDRAIARIRQTQRKRTPADIHALKIEERRARRRASRLRGKTKAV